MGFFEEWLMIIGCAAFGMICAAAIIYGLPHIGKKIYNALKGVFQNAKIAYCNRRKKS